AHHATDRIPRTLSFALQANEPRTVGVALLDLARQLPQRSMELIVLQRLGRLRRLGADLDQEPLEVGRRAVDPLEQPRTGRLYRGELGRDIRQVAGGV